MLTSTAAILQIGGPPTGAFHSRRLQEDEGNSEKLDQVGNAETEASGEQMVSDGN